MSICLDTHKRYGGLKEKLLKIT